MTAAVIMVQIKVDFKSTSFKIPRLKARGEFAVPIYLPAFSLPSIIAS